MRRPAFLLAAMATLAFVLLPAFAEARPGGRNSSGSRGSQTYSAPPPTQTAPGTAQRFDRTATQPGTPANAATAARPGMAGAAATQNRGFFGSFGGALLMGGLIGGLLGYGLFAGGAGFGAILGMLLQVALIGLAIFFVVRLVRGRRPAVAAGPQQGYAFQAQPEPRAQGGLGGGLKAAAPARAPVSIGPTDYKAFEQTLVEINAAWSKRDLAALRAIATPEMVSYFAQDMRDLEARNWRNETRDVRLEQGDLSEAWAEEGQEYATVAMRFSLLDATFDNATNAVVEGSTTERQTATEIWTFVREAPAGRWMLSAIQQTA
ncbi:TIM44-like domain-containing protein [Roseomonas sp. PWR1]|uniref:TIM44-like domain-containing protein n=1 Tax=Roseomonas nitratireducens TaxID=2820810 RepID=A0ABS4AS57_9PROT|nr:TIM44-like domain-containing protein [Neoroseomonas nitratireducens]MBP0464122.1 TIM44-like domain-containing protein [Neoroseomonas nitratireducens]